MARFESDQQGLRELGRTREMGRAMERVAREVGVPAFQGAAPVGPTGGYRVRVGVESQTSDSGLAGAALVLYPDDEGNSFDPTAITFGTVDTPEHNALQLAREAMERA